MKKVVIAGSVSLSEEIEKWQGYWQNNGCEVIALPEQIDASEFHKKYPEVLVKFIDQIKYADVFFVMNETKNGIHGYIGAETFAETCFALMQNLLEDRNIKILLLQKPSKIVQCYKEIDLWLGYGWVEVLFS